MFLHEGKASYLVVRWLKSNPDSASKQDLIWKWGLHRCSEDSLSEVGTIQWIFMKETRQTQGGGKVTTQARLDGRRNPEKPDGEGGLSPWTLQSNLGS